MNRPSVAIIGIGAMGRALATGLLAAGWAPDQLSLAIRRPEQVEALRAETGIAVTLDPRQASSGREVIVVAVKPRDISILLDAVGSAITVEQVVLSIAAGVPTTTFREGAGEVPVVRAMPNTSGARWLRRDRIAAGRFATEADVGQTRVVPRRWDRFEPWTRASSMRSRQYRYGPAYVFLLAEALTEAAVREGLPRMLQSRSCIRRSAAPVTLLTETGQGPSECVRR